MIIEASPNDLRLLESKFTSKGHEFEKVAEGPTYFVYQVKRLDSPRNWFEVFQKRIHRSRVIVGKDGETSTLPRAEAYPSDAAFGSWAWTFQRLDAAMAKARTLKPHSSTLKGGEG